MTRGYITLCFNLTRGGLIFPTETSGRIRDLEKPINLFRIGQRHYPVNVESWKRNGFMQEEKACRRLYRAAVVLIRLVYGLISVLEW